MLVQTSGQNSTFTFGTWVFFNLIYSQQSKIKMGVTIHELPFLGHLYTSHISQLSLWIYSCSHLILWYPCVSLYHFPALCVFVHRCHIIYMDEWPSRGRVTLSKIICAVTAQFSALNSLFQTGTNITFPRDGVSRTHHSLVLHTDVSRTRMTVWFSNGIVV